MEIPSYTPSYTKVEEMEKYNRAFLNREITGLDNVEIPISPTKSIKLADYLQNKVKEYSYGEDPVLAKIKEPEIREFLKKNEKTGKIKTSFFHYLYQIMGKMYYDLFDSPYEPLQTPEEARLALKFALLYGGDDYSNPFYQLYGLKLADIGLYLPVEKDGKVIEKYISLGKNKKLALDLIDGKEVKINGETYKLGIPTDAFNPEMIYEPFSSEVLIDKYGQPSYKIILYPTQAMLSKNSEVVTDKDDNLISGLPLETNKVVEQVFDIRPTLRYEGTIPGTDITGVRIKDLPTIVTYTGTNFFKNAPDYYKLEHGPNDDFVPDLSWKAMNIPSDLKHYFSSFK
jgi:hypothetical protein